MSLDHDQQYVLDNLAARNIVIAGAGSGKTRLLVAILNKLIEEEVPADKIVLATFTRETSRQMRSQSEQKTGKSLGELNCGTFHSLAAAILAEQAHMTVRVLDEEEALFMIEEIGRKIALERDEEDLELPRPAAIMKEMSGARETNRPSFLDWPRQSFFLLLEQEYRRLKKADNLFDYDDLLLELRDFLRGRGAGWSKTIKAVLVDEAQDLDPLQQEIVDLLGADLLVLIGDPGQCIYSWRGVNNQAMYDWAESGTVFHLRKNYRSNPQIVSLANLITPPGPFAKEMEPVREGGERPRLISPASPAAEAILVADWLEGHHYQGAVLARTHKHLIPIKNELGLRAVEFNYLGRGVEDPLLIKLRALMRLSDNPLDRRAWLSFLQEVEAADAILKTDDPLSALLLKQPQLGDLISLIRTGEPSPSLWRRLCYGPLFELVGPRSLPLAEQVNDDNVFEAKESVITSGLSLGTIHGGKGLEWDCLAIVSLGQGAFPLGRGSDEELRLFYVAVTRARDQLLLSRAGWLSGTGFLSEGVLLKLEEEPQ